ncbi:nuclear body protein SP140-like protein isoform X2 [Ictalurus furcatus]|uniref:nuclear body protein SP140-like protein isoform X2 n=1 Tax=Ictalurus furcatus TaxID=66913 RepID=UPI0023506EB9|nr:nuclear body protein SP140-like protein isoform X2 [Ictalurus furcatus]
MDPLDFLTEEELIKFFHCKKTEISCMEEPHTFLNQLRDHNLVPEDLYQKVIKMRSKERRQDGVYEILNWLENERGQCVKLFWSCVFQDHILQKYPILRFLRKSLLDGQSLHLFFFLVFFLKALIVCRYCDSAIILIVSVSRSGSFKNYEKLPDTEETNNNENKSVQKEEKKVQGKKGGGKRKKSVEEPEEEEEPGPSSCSTPVRKKPTTRPTFSSPLIRGQKADIWTWGLYKTFLPVTCGDKEGTLYRDKLAKGMKCILSKGHWFTPSGFEKFAGKANYKNWKLSIRCQNTPLKKLIQCPHTKRRCVRKSRRVLFPVGYSESSSSQSESDEEMEGSSEDQEEEREEDRGQEEEEEVDDEEEEDNEEEEEDNEEERDDEEEEEEGLEEEEEGDDEEEDVEEEKEGNEEERQPLDPVFEAAVLPVSCGSVTGALYKIRFAGPRSKSIRTEECWFTPEEFVKQELTDGHWKRDILCHGQTLSYLVEMKILYIHSLLCECYRCRPADPLALNNDDVCFICDSDGDDDGQLVCCDECPRAFHPNCHLPPSQNNAHGEKWTCTFCIWRINHQMWTHMSLEDALNSSANQNIMRCEYLLLCLYKEDTQHVFADDPVTTEESYSSMISNPMWLNSVRNKLQRNHYSTVGEFVGDIRLIFQNCQTFNRGNELGMMGARLSEIFEQKLHIVFKIQ